VGVHPVHGVEPAQVIAHSSICAASFSQLRFGSRETIKRVQGMARKTIEKSQSQYQLQSQSQLQLQTQLQSHSEWVILISGHPKALYNRKAGLVKILSITKKAKETSTLW